MRWLKANWAGVTVALLLVIGAWMRATTYGNLHLSIGMPDTPGYVTSAAAPLISRDMLSGRRSFTSNLLYQLATDETCPEPRLSKPGLGLESERALQACFGNIALTQNILSILGWSALAWVIARRMRHPLYKILAALVIVTFGFTPQLAEWDSVLSSEALSLSLFPLMLALLTELVFRIGEGRADASLRTIGLVAAWMVVLFLWISVRDVQSYSIVAILGVTVPLLLFKSVRRVKFIIPVLVLLAALFVIGSSALHRSTRWQASIQNTIIANILPYPARVEFFQSKGMPDPAAAEEFAAWFNQRGDRTYALFLATHPGYVFTTVIENWEAFATDSFQPYFQPTDIEHRDTLLLLGSLVHPETIAVYLIDLLLLLAVGISALKQRNGNAWSWAWLAVWMFLFGTASLLISYFGDVNGARRHIFPSVELFRLYLWIFLFGVMDGGNESAGQRVVNPA